MKFLVSILAAFYLNACATTAKVVHVSDMHRLTPASVGAAIPIEFESTNSPLGRTGCLMVLTRDESSVTYEVAFKPGVETLFAELPVGSYWFREVFCGSGHWDVTYHGWPRFMVYPNAISLVGGVEISMNSENQIVTKVMKRTKSRDEALKLFGRLPVADTKRAVSAYTGRPVVAQAVEKAPPWDRKWTVNGGEARTDEDWPEFQRCLDGEADANGLWLGGLTFEPVFENGKFSKMEKPKGWSTFTSHFTECITDVIKSFHPQSKGRLAYVLYL